MMITQLEITESHNIWNRVLPQTLIRCRAGTGETKHEKIHKKN